MSENIKTIVLSTGDKVIGNILNVTEDTMVIKQPFILREIMTNEGISIAPLPFVNSSDEIISINRRHIMVDGCTPTKEITNMYIQMTSNILIPKTNLV